MGDIDKLGEFERDRFVEIAGAVFDPIFSTGVVKAGWDEATAFLAEQLVDVAADFEQIDTGSNDEESNARGGFGRSVQLAARGESAFRSADSNPFIPLSTTATSGALLSLRTMIETNAKVSSTSLPTGTHTSVLGESDGVRAEATTTTDVRFDNVGGKLVAEVSIKLEFVAVNVATRAAVAKAEGTSSARFTAMLCPDLDGTVQFGGDVEIRAGTYRDATEVRASIQVGDDAYVRTVTTSGTTSSSVDGISSEVSFQATSPLLRPGATGGFVPEITSVDDGRNLGTQSLTRSFEQGLRTAALLHLVAAEAEKQWRNGACVEIRSDDVALSNTVEPGSTTTFLAELWHIIDGRPADETITVRLDGDESITPVGPEPSPVRYRYLAGDKDSGRATVNLESVSKRGIARLSIAFKIEPAGWTLDPPEAVGVPTRWTGSRCDTTEPTGTWTANVKADFDSTAYVETITITAFSDGTATWRGEARADTDPPTFVRNDGTGNWTKEQSGDVVFDLLLTEAITAWSGDQSQSTSKPGEFTLRWTAGGCDK